MIARREAAHRQLKDRLDMEKYMREEEARAAVSSDTVGCKFSHANLLHAGRLQHGTRLHLSVWTRARIKIPALPC